MTGECFCMSVFVWFGIVLFWWSTSCSFSSVDRASVYETEGPRFESVMELKFASWFFLLLFYFCCSLFVACCFVYFVDLHLHLHLQQINKSHEQTKQKSLNQQIDSTAPSNRMTMHVTWWMSMTWWFRSSVVERLINTQKARSSILREINVSFYIFSMFAFVFLHLLYEFVFFLVWLVSWIHCIVLCCVMLWVYKCQIMSWFDVPNVNQNKAK